MREWDVDRVAGAAGAEVVCRPRAGAGTPGPTGVSIDSRRVERGDLFVGLTGERTDGGRHAGEALERGAWGVLVTPERAEVAAKALRDAEEPSVKDAKRPSAKTSSSSSSSSTTTNTISKPIREGAVLACEDPLRAMQRLATEWVMELQGEGMRVVGVTGSTGKTSTKDILSALLTPQLRTLASPDNQNTEIGMPLAILGAPTGTQALVLEMAMRGPGQIAELAAIAQPDVGVIVNVGPVHLEQLGSLEGVAAAKAELVAGLRPGATAIVPADEPLLEPYRRSDLRTVTFGAGGDVWLRERGEGGERKASGKRREKGERGESGESWEVVVVDRTSGNLEEIVLKVGFEQEHNLKNLVAAVAAARAIGVTPAGEVRVRFSQMRGQRKALPAKGVEVIEDCYNANPMSMRAAIDDLVATAPGRRMAVLGDMLELGPDEDRYHREIGEYAAVRGVDVLVTAGQRATEIAHAFESRGRRAHAAEDAEAAGELLKGLLEQGDTVLVKGSRGVGMERVVEVLGAPSVASDVSPANVPASAASAPAPPANVPASAEHAPDPAPEAALTRTAGN